MIQLSVPTQLQRRRRDDQLLYLMLKPPNTVALEIDRLRRTYGIGDRYPLGRLHITLQPFGDIRLLPGDDLTNFRHALTTFFAAPFWITLDRIRGNALVGSRIRPLLAFQRLLAAHLTGLDILPSGYAFKPHLSLSYGTPEALNLIIPPISWIADELLLINSIHGKGHQVIDRWPLVSRQSAFTF
jgi:RNA 2',3'-cyclic 3'-phosphodiesterase